MQWKRLLEWDDDAIWEGAVIRAHPSHLGEATDFMVFSPHQEGYGQGLVYITGYHAGQIYIILPVESRPPGARAISKNWLINNWTKYIDSDGDPKDVCVAERYPTPD